MITVRIEGMPALLATLEGKQKQVRYAASRALNNVAFKINAEIKEEMKRIFKGGPTAFSLRAFRVDRASPDNLTAAVRLRDDSPDGGTSYAKALQHLFSGGNRFQKRLEGFFRALHVIPEGMMAVPGAAAKLDGRGNMSLSDLREMLGVLRSSIRNVRVYRFTGRAKVAKHTGYFVIPVGARLHPGIWKRIETAGSSVVLPMIMFVKPGRYKQLINLKNIAEKQVASHWRNEFAAELSKAMANAR